MLTSPENFCKVLLVSIQIHFFFIIPEFGYHFDNSNEERNKYNF
jgi:hypothetical protein